MLNDSVGSAASDGSFLMLSIPSEAGKSPVGSVSRRIAERSHQPARELAMRPLDASTLSDMFSMLGACAPLSGNPLDRVARPADLGENISSRERNREEQQGDGSRSSPKGKRKQQTRLSAAVAAAMSSKDASGFRSLRRISQASAHRDEEHDAGPAHPITPHNGGGDAAAAAKVGLSPHNDDVGSRQGSVGDSMSSLTSRGLPGGGPPARARRTVSLGFTETTAKHDLSEAHPRAMAELRGKGEVAAAPGDGCSERSKRDHDKFREPSGMLGTTVGSSSTSKGLCSDTPAEDASSSTGNAGSPRRRRAEPTKSGTAAAEGCRSGGDAAFKRNTRSRSSSSESPLRREPSSRGRNADQRLHNREPNDSSETQDSGHRRETEDTSKSCEGAQASECLQQSGMAGHPLSHEKPSEDERLEADAKTEPRKSADADICSPRGTSRQLRPEERAPPRQHLQQALGEKCSKLPDEQAASAAALLAAAAGVVDASLQQQQQMIQRQQEHHEDLQRAQQLRIDMLQEQLEVLQRNKEQQRESGEQQQKQMIETLQAKLEELQRRQEQRDQSFQEAQRKLLQQELEVQLKQRFEELRCSTQRPSLETAGAYSVEQDDVRAQRLGTDVRSSQRGEVGYARITSSVGRASNGLSGQEAAHRAALQESEWKRVSGVHSTGITVSEKTTGGNTARVSQLLPSRQHSGDTLDSRTWQHGGEEQLGGAGRSGLRRPTADIRNQHLMDTPGSGFSEAVDQGCDSDGSSSCASSSIMGSRCGLAGPGCMVEDMPTTSSSSFVSQAATSGACSSLSSQRAGHFASDRNFERQVYGLGNERLPSQVAPAQSLGALHRHSRLRHQPSESLLGFHHNIPILPGHPDPLLSACAVQRVNSSTGSLWSPKASRSQVSGLGDRAGGGGATVGGRSHADLLVSNTGSMMSPAGIQERLLPGELHYSSGGLGHRPDPDRPSRGTGTGLGRSTMSAYHPVSRAERIGPAQQTPIDSARFLGSSSIGEKRISGSEMARYDHGTLPFHEPQSTGPPASARSIASTSSYATTSTNRAPLTHASRIPQRTRDSNGGAPPSADFLGMTSARSTTSRNQADYRRSEASRTKPSGHTKCSESQLPPSPGRPRSESGGRSTRPPNATTGRDSLISGSRRTVNSLTSKLKRPSVSDFQTPRRKNSLGSCSVGIDASACGPRASFQRERFENSEAAAAYYRRGTTSETLPDVEMPHSASHHSHKARRGSGRKDKSDCRPERDDQQAEKTTAGDSSSSGQLSMDWTGFNSGFMSQVQKWIS